MLELAIAVIAIGLTRGVAGRSVPIMICVAGLVGVSACDSSLPPESRPHIVTDKTAYEVLEVEGVMSLSIGFVYSNPTERVLAMDAECNDEGIIDIQGREGDEWVRVLGAELRLCSKVRIIGPGEEYGGNIIIAAREGDQHPSALFMDAIPGTFRLHAPDVSSRGRLLSLQERTSNEFHVGRGS